MRKTARRGSRLVSVAAAVLLAMVVPAGAQSIPPIEIVGSDLSGFPTVRLSIAVSGEASVTQLEAADLAVTENGDDVVFEVTPPSSEAIDVVLAIDTSGSMTGEPLAQAKVAALQFLDQLPPTARAAIVSFGDSAELRSGFTTNRDTSREAVNGLTEGGETALYDAVSLASQQVNASDATRSAVVVLSDGADTASGTPLDEVRADLQDTVTDFFAVSLQSGDADEAALRQLADAASGRVVPATDPEALAGAYVDLGQRISNRYEIVFESVSPDLTGTFVVEVVGTGDSDSVEIALPGRATSVSPDEVAEPVAPVERLVSEGSTGLLQRNWALWIGAFLVVAAMLAIGYAVAPSGGSSRRRTLTSDRVADAGAGAGERMLASVRESATRVTTRAVERTERSGVIDASLDRAGIVMRAGEFVAVVVAVQVVAAFLLYLLMGPVGAALGVLVPAMGAPAFLRLLARRRNQKFADQLGDALMLMAGALRSGFGMNAAIDNVADEMDAPISTEFRRAILEARLGRDIEDSLGSVAARVENEDFEWVIDAMRIHRQVGGDLAQILDQVADTIRARNRLRRQIDALTAEGRLSALVLGVLPIGMALVLYTSNRDYLTPLFDRTAGQLMLGAGIGLLVIGVIWLRKLIDVEL